MIVFDASTLILIAKIDLLEVFLRGIGMEVVIPQAVEEECCAARKSLDALMIQKALDESRIKVIPARESSLRRGECESIAVALREKASLVGIDDRNGINACKLLRIPFTTAIAILVRSYEKRLLSQSEALAMLTALANHAWYRNSFIEDARRRLEEPL
jgi:predicted nucleic acid-binding protein